MSHTFRQRDKRVKLTHDYEMEFVLVVLQRMPYNEKFLMGFLH